MNFRNRDCATFGQISDAWAQEKEGELWPLRRDGYLHKLLAPFWLGAFEDEAGRSFLTLDDHQGRAERTNRQLTYGVFPKADYWTPPAVRQARQGEPPWDALAAMKPREYDETWRRVFLERLTITKSDFRAWVLDAEGYLPAFWFQGEERAAVVSPSPLTHSGLPGRPSPKHLYLAELERRAEAGTLCKTVSAESRALHEWLRKTHPELSPGTEKTVENTIRDRHRKLKADHPPK